MKSIFTKNPKLLKAAVYGANDGITTTFAVVAGVTGATLASKVVLILGIGNMIADGLSMGLGDFLGERSEKRLRHKKGEKTSDKDIWKTGLVTFIAFVIAGSFPLIPYALDLFGFMSVPNLFQASVCATAVILFGVGSARTVITGGTWWKHGLEMLGIGSITAGVAYFLGAFVQKII